MDEYTPCKKPDPTAREAVGNVMRLLHTQRKKPNKYHARKTTVCGHTFDSKREADYYLELLARKQAGEIVRIGFQPSYTLLASGTTRERSSVPSPTRRTFSSPTPTDTAR